MKIETLKRMSWPKRIEWANKIESHTYDNLELFAYLEDEAGAWQTCVCGKLDRHILRDNWHRPLDSKLRALGESFADNIISRQWDKALITIIAIEARAIQVLSEQKVEE